MAKAARKEILTKIGAALRGDNQRQTSIVRGEASASVSMPQPVRYVKEDGENRERELIDRFEFELIGVGAHFHRAGGVQEVCDYAKSLTAGQSVKSAISWNASKFGGRELAQTLEGAGVEVTQDNRGIGREDFINKSIKADLCISGVDYALADTGTLILCAGEGKARSASLLAPIHIAILKPNQIIPGLNALFSLLSGAELSSAVTFITGPSRTADIEMTLVVGVHGPQQLHVILQEG